jgi:hypothetical protein
MILQADSLPEILNILGTGVVQTFGGSATLLGLIIVLIIAIFCWQRNQHMTTTYFLCFMGMTFLRIFVNDTTFSDAGLFGTLYNILLLVTAIVFAKILTSEVT